ncbi:MAG: hypothetical protein ACYC39_09465 [Thiobacillus sp.]
MEMIASIMEKTRLFGGMAWGLWSLLTGGHPVITLIVIAAGVAFAVNLWAMLGSFS